MFAECSPITFGLYGEGKRNTVSLNISSGEARIGGSSFEAARISTIAAAEVEGHVFLLCARGLSWPDDFR